MLKAIMQAEFDILAQRLTFLLCQARHDGEQHLTLGIHGVDVVFSKKTGMFSLSVPRYISDSPEYF